MVGVVLVAALTGCAGDGTVGTAASTAPEDASVTASATAAAAPGPDDTIADVLRSDPRFSRFRDVVARTQTPIADSVLDVWDWPATRMGDDRDGVTLFVPIDAAFEALDPAILAVLEDPDVDNALLYDLFGHHYVHRLYPSSAFEAGDQQTWSRSAGGAVQLGLDPPTWGGHPIVEADIRAANGWIHAVDGVVVPDDLAAAAAGGPS